MAQSVKNLPAIRSIPGLRRSPEGGHGNPLQCSRLETPMDRGARRAAVHRVTKSQTRLSTHTYVQRIVKIISSEYLNDDQYIVYQEGIFTIYHHCKFFQ